MRFVEVAMARLKIVLSAGFVVLLVLFYLNFYQYDYCKAVPQPGDVTQVPLQLELPTAVKIEAPSVQPPRGLVYVYVFSGRWKYLRILLPYLYRELRQNGGVVDKVVFAMIGYTEETQGKLKNFSATANGILKEETFLFAYFKNDATTGRISLLPFYANFHYHVLQRLVENPLDVYFKLDDDIVFLRPNVFGILLKNKNPSDCFIHFANTVSNWRCNWRHDQMGLYNNEVNPNGLKIDYHPNGECGWKRADCAEMVLRAFIHYYHKNQTSKYLFAGRDHTTDRKRFSINFFLIDGSLIDMKRMLQMGLIGDDEDWWTVKYSKDAPNPNCIVGEAFVVHFSYFTTEKNMLDLGLLKEFENIVRLELAESLPRILWKATDFL